VNFDVEAGGRQRTVEITGAGDAYRAVVDGRVYAVDVARLGDIWSLLAGSAEPVSTPMLRPGRSYEVMIGDQAGGELTIYVNRGAVPVSLRGFAGLRAQRRAARGDRTGDTRSGPLNVVAPMPGRIVKVLVKAGDPVAARQGVVIVEAMKMENEVRAPRAGTVKEVRVTQGALVEARTVVVVID
jgi:acetyl/propionyl-CoA carboxylase alpha subunit